MYTFLDITFLVIHTAVILFNLFGWIWKLTRKANLILLLSTAGSWFILGIWYGIGYCPLTDWHWQVLRKMGNNNLPNSYVKYIFDRIFGTDINAGTADIWVAVLFGAALIISIHLNARTKRV
ncbi:MAG: hypothetical protein COB85_09620 [Bacteroidetes bacterium]|nr:MAG: hypothetical protein COB85_09620 [Bacteroidota bacterium]